MKTWIPLFFLTTLLDKFNAIQGNRREHKKEYCQNEQFTAECGPAEVIIIKYANYGRMELGNCITSNFGYLSCKDDVLDVADYFCSGRRTCELSVPNEHLDARKSSCPDDMITYLQIDYDCVPAVSPNSCFNQPLQLDTPGLISSSVPASVTKNCHASEPYPQYILNAQPGQTIQLSLYDFTRLKQSNSNNGGGVAQSFGCSGGIAYLIVKESGQEVPEPKTICATGTRYSDVFVSQSHVLRVNVIRQNNRGAERPFLLNYTFKGCPMPASPVGGHFRKSGDKLILHCNATDDVTELTCVNDKWQGKRTECYLIGSSTAEPGSWPDVNLSRMSAELMILLITATAVVIAVCIIGVGVIILRRRYHDYVIPPPPMEYQHTVPIYPDQPAQPGSNTTDANKYSGSTRSHENDYASIKDYMSTFYPDQKCSAGVCRGGNTCPRQKYCKYAPRGGGRSPYGCLECEPKTPRPVAKPTLCQTPKPDIQGGPIPEALPLQPSRDECQRVCGPLINTDGRYSY